MINRLLTKKSKFPGDLKNISRKTKTLYDKVTPDYVQLTAIFK